MSSALLILHTSCVSDFDSERRIECEFLLLPEFPVAENENAVMDRLYPEAQSVVPATTNDPYDSSIWKAALEYQPAKYQKKSRHRLNPCGHQNLVVLNDLPSFSGVPSFLLTITSCSMHLVADEVDILGVAQSGKYGRSPLPVQASPSNFAFALDELFSLDISNPSSPLTFLGFAELYVTFDFKFAHRILTERRALSQQHQPNGTQIMSENGTKGAQNANRSCPVEPIMSNDCPYAITEFPRVFLQTLADKEAGDFKKIMMFQGVLGVAICVLVVWMGIVACSRPRLLRVSKALAGSVPKNAHMASGIERSNQGGVGVRCESTENLDVTFPAYNNSRSSNNQNNAFATNNSALMSPPPRNSCGGKPDFPMMYDQLGNSIPEGSAQLRIRTDHDEPCEDEEQRPELDLSSSATKVTSFAWKSQWLENKSHRQSIRKLKRQARQHQGQPTFVTPKSHAPLIGTDHPSCNLFSVAESTTEQECQWVGFTFDETSVQGDSFVQQYWEL